jgi:hypothetical protein
MQAYRSGKHLNGWGGAIPQRIERIERIARVLTWILPKLDLMQGHSQACVCYMSMLASLQQWSFLPVCVD